MPGRWPSCAEECEKEDVGVERREDAEGAAEVEALQADGAGLSLLAQQQRGDEVAGDDEEDEDAKSPVAQQAQGVPGDWIWVRAVWRSSVVQDDDQQRRRARAGRRGLGMCRGRSMGAERASAMKVTATRRRRNVPSSHMREVGAPSSDGSRSGGEDDLAAGAAFFCEGLGCAASDRGMRLSMGSLSLPSRMASP